MGAVKRQRGINHQWFTVTLHSFYSSSINAAFLIYCHAAQKIKTYVYTMQLAQIRDQTSSHPNPAAAVSLSYTVQSGPFTDNRSQGAAAMMV